MCSPACWLSSDPFLHSHSSRQAGNSATYSGLALPTPVNLIMVPTDTPMGQPNIDRPSLRLSSGVILGCVKLTIKARHDTGVSNHIAFFPTLIMAIEYVESSFLLIYGGPFLCLCSSYRLGRLCFVFFCYFN